MKKLALAAIIATTISCSAPKQLFEPITLEEKITQEHVDELKEKYKKTKFSFERTEIDKEINEAEKILKYQEYINTQDFEKVKEVIKKDLEKEWSTKGKVFYKEKLQEVEELEVKRDSLFSQILKSRNTFNNEYEQLKGKRSKEELKQTEFFLYSILKYAQIKSPEKVKVIEEHYNNTRAQVLDKEYEEESLEKTVGKSQEKFQKRLEEMIEKENKDFEEIYEYVDKSQEYAKLTKSHIPTRYFELTKKQLEAYNMKQQQTNDKTNKITNMEIIRMDELNTPGIYSYKDKIVVITEIPLETYDIRVNKGTIIYESDKQLYRFLLNSNKIKKGDDLKIKGGDIIPFGNGNQIVNYKYTDNRNPEGKVIAQGRVVYTRVGSRSQTKKLTEKYLAPISLDSIPSIIFDKIYEKK